MNHLESCKWFTVFVQMQDGKLITVHKMAVSSWHAVDKVYFELCDDQPNRKRYIAHRTIKSALLN